MALFFFLSGAFMPHSYDRKGPGRFGLDRSIRLGAPVLFGVLLLIPLQAWFFHQAYRDLPPIGYWNYFSGYFLGFAAHPANWPAASSFPELELGHLWFIQHLWIYAGLYVVWRVFVSPDPIANRRSGPPGNVAIFLFAMGLTVATWVIRIWFPQDTWTGLLGFIQMEPAPLAPIRGLVRPGNRGWDDLVGSSRCRAGAESVGPRLACCYPLQSTSVRALIFCRPGTRKAGSSVRGRRFSVSDCASPCRCCFEGSHGQFFRGSACSRTNVFPVYVFHFPIVMLIQWSLLGSGLSVGACALVTVLLGVVLSFLFSQFVVLRIPGARRVF